MFALSVRCNHVGSGFKFYMNMNMKIVSTQVNHSRYTTQCAPKYPDDPKSYAHLALAMLLCYLVPMIVIIVCSGNVTPEQQQQHSF